MAWSNVCCSLVWKLFAGTCKIAPRERGTFWKRSFAPSLGQYYEENNNNKIKETVVAEVHETFQLMENAYSQGMTAQHLEMNGQGLKQDRIYIAMGFILDGKKPHRDWNSRGIYLGNAALQSYENMEH